MAPEPPPTIPSIEASVIAEKVAPNSQAWRSQAEDLAEENKLLREEIARLKAKKSESKTKQTKAKDWQTFTVTAYTSGYESTQKHAGEEGYGITASGKPVQAGVTVACAPDIPFGTRLEIEGVGERVCTDRGGRITQGHIDVYMPELADAREFGRKALRVRILK